MQREIIVSEFDSRDDGNQEKMLLNRVPSNEEYS